MTWSPQSGHPINGTTTERPRSPERGNGGRRQWLRRRGRSLGARVGESRERGRRAGSDQVGGNGRGDGDGDWELELGRAESRERGRGAGSNQVGGSVRPGERLGPTRWWGGAALLFWHFCKKKPRYLHIQASEQMWQSAHMWQLLTWARSAHTYKKSYFGPYVTP